MVLWVGRLALAQAGTKLLSVKGEGVQIYSCQQTAGAAAWVLTGPEARLLDDAGKDVGQHGAGPVWSYKDGSSVRGEAVTKTASPEAGAVPWLVLRAVRPEGSGLLSQVTEIRRIETHGGAAPSSGCDAEHIGAMVRVKYTARYEFYRQP